MSTPRTFTAAVHQEEDWYVAQCLELDVASQGPTLEEALANLREAVALYLDEVDDPESRACGYGARLRRATSARAGPSSTAVTFETATGEVDGQLPRAAADLEHTAAGLQPGERDQVVDGRAGVPGPRHVVGLRHPVEQRPQAAPPLVVHQPDIRCRPRTASSASFS